ncbi:MAG TPA: hypothetical protein VGC27_05490, partial [Rhizomicrobium sp.]
MANGDGGNTSAPSGAAGRAPRIGMQRWVICALLFAATSLLYVDRNTLGFLKHDLSVQYGWDQAEYAHIVQWFMV